MFTVNPWGHEVKSMISTIFQACLEKGPWNATTPLALRQFSIVTLYLPFRRLSLCTTWILGPKKSGSSDKARWMREHPTRKIEKKHHSEKKTARYECLEQGDFHSFRWVPLQSLPRFLFALVLMVVWCFSGVGNMKNSCTEWIFTKSWFQQNWTERVYHSFPQMSWWCLQPLLAIVFNKEVCDTCWVNWNR